MLYPTSTSSSDSAAEGEVVLAAGALDANEADGIDAQTWRSLLHLGKIVLVLGACALASYLVPGLDRVRPWVQGEGMPIARLFGSEHRAELPEFQRAAAPSRPSEEDASPRPQPASADPEEAGRDPAGPRADTAVRIDPSEYADLPQPLENKAALRAFYEQLRRSAQQEASAITRVAHYGDSAIAADEITHTARRKLQKRFGDAGHGFMLAARGTMHYLHRDIVHRESNGWEVLTIVRRPLRDGRYGYGGVMARASAGEHTLFGTMDDGVVGQRASRYEVFFQRFPGGGDLKLTVGGASQVLSTRGASVEDGFHLIEVPDGSHQLTLRTLGAEVRLYGVVQERSVPGVVYDSLGLVGARADRLLDAEPEHMAKQIAHRDPHLLVLAFGGNEAGNAWLDLERYERDLVKVVRLMRSGKPQMSCLLFAPLDQGQRNDRGEVVTIDILPRIVELQRRVALAEGCAFFDTFSAMGGPGSVARWYKERPRLVTSDFRHATPAGYAVIGTAYYKALLQGFAEFLSAP